MAAAGNIAGMESLVGLQISSLTGEHQNLLSQIGSLSPQVALAEQQLSYLNGLSHSQIISNFAPSTQLDPKGKAIAATEAYLSERRSQIESVTSARNTLAGLQRRHEFVQGALGKYQSLDGAMRTVEPAKQASTVLTMVGSYKDQSQNAVGTLLTTQNVLGQVRGRLANDSQDLVLNRLPVEGVLSQLPSVSGLLAGGSSETFSPLREGSEFFSSELSAIRSISGSALSPFQARMTQGISSLNSRFLNFQNGSFLSSVQGQISSLTSAVSGLQSQLTSVMGPLTSVMDKFRGASSVCDATLAQLSSLISGLDFSGLTGTVGQFFNGIQGQMGQYIGRMNQQLRAAIEPACAGIPFPIPGVCLGTSSAIYIEARMSMRARRQQQRQRQQRRQVNRCCNQFRDHQIPQCAARQTLQCVTPDPTMRRVRGPRRKQRARQCFRTFRIEMRQCRRTLNRNPGVAEVPAYPQLTAPEALQTLDELVVGIERVEAYVQSVLSHSRAFPSSGLSHVYREVHGYDPYVVSNEAVAELQRFIVDPRYQEFR